MMLCCLALAACATATPATSSAPSVGASSPAVRSDESARSDETARAADDAADRWKQRASDAYNAGYEDGQEKNGDNFSNWAKKH